MLKGVIEMPNISVPLPNIGFDVYVSDYKVTPTQNDIIGSIRSISGMGFNVETSDATTVSSKDGFSRPAPTLKVAKPFTVTVFMHNEGYNKILNRFMKNSVTDSKFYCSVTIVIPKVQGVSEQVPNYTYHGFISDLSMSDVETSQFQTFSFQFTPIEAPTVFDGFGTSSK